MKGGERPSGFTIVEVLIVLAVSGLIFLSAALMIAGKQQRTGFITSINDVQARLQQVINDVVNGYYPKESAFKCTSNAPSAPPTITTPGNDTQGTHATLDNSDTLNGCAFLGKAVQFDVNSTNSSQINIYPVIGNLEGSNGQPAQGLADSYPILLAGGNTPDTNQGFGMTFTEIYNMEFGLNVSWVCYSTGSSTCSTSPAPSTNTAVIIFASNPSVASTGAALSSGSQQVETVPVPASDSHTSLGQSFGDTVTNIDSYFNPSGGAGANLIENPTGGVEICVADSGTNQSGLITIGSDKGVPDITLQVKNGSTTCS